MLDHYNTLGVPQGAPFEDIRTAYKRLAKAYHPDRNQEGGELFKDITAAYDILSDDDARRQYDVDRAPKPTRSDPAPQDEVSVNERANADKEKVCGI